MDYQTDDGFRILEHTPGAFAALLSGLTDPWLSADEGPDTWTPWEVMAHMTDLERTDWLPRVQIILEHGNGRPFDPVDRTAFRSRLAGRSIGSLVEEFSQLRRDNLVTLRALQLDGDRLQAPGAHPSLGDVTLSQLLAAWVVHDLTHLVQISRVVAKQYTAAVGPWREYLGVLNR